ncbi:MAG: pullulanase-type alpha-1,6-glucosidase [Candidatus Eisenbacteria bacterium]
MPRLLPIRQTQPRLHDHGTARTVGYRAIALFLLLSAMFAHAIDVLAAPVEFRYLPAEGKATTSVSVRGNFNDWSETAMKKGADGAWSVTVEASGEVVYKFFIDGQWPSDMSTGRDGGPIDDAAESYVDDGFGGKNAVRQISGSSAPAPPLFEIAPAPALTKDTARVHYHRPDGTYRGWGLHTWMDASSPTEWTSPLTPTGQTEWGVYWDIPLAKDAARLGFLIHNGDNKDPGPDQFLAIEDGRTEVWIVSGQNKLFLETPDVTRFALGDMSQLRAHWVDRRTVLWNVPGAKTVRLVSSPTASLEAAETGLIDGAGSANRPGSSGGGSAKGGEGTGETSSDRPSGSATNGNSDGRVRGESVTLHSTTLDPEVRVRFPHLAGISAWRLADADAAKAPSMLRGQLAVCAYDGDGRALQVAGVQVPGVLDDLYTYDGPLGIAWKGSTPSLYLWAPTALDVRLLLFRDSADASPIETIPMMRDDASGTWSAKGTSTWNGLFYLYEVEVFAPSTGRIETNRVTDPYSRSLSMDSRRSQIIDMNDPTLVPDGWGRSPKPTMAAPEDIVLYELHVRDFSALDAGTPPELRGTFRAFTVDTPPTRHLKRLAAAGLTHVHLLPSFDIATVHEDRATWPMLRLPDDDITGAAVPESEKAPVTLAALEALAPNSEEQQARLTPLRGDDGYNWGYDPYHFGVPEGSYSTDPDGPTRILEFREMVQSLQGIGLRVIMDVVYNHTHASGQSPQSVFDQIVPGYYHRLDENGNVHTSTCCANTASEHAMMERFIGDDLVHWAKDYRVDGFRFDLMGHHMKSNLETWQTRLRALTPEVDGVDGSAIYLYGEGWDFGEVQGGKRGPNATQVNLAGTGIGTFNDRIRDSIRGGNPFGDRREQGFVTGLFLEPAFNGNTAAERNRLLESMDKIRVGMAGNLASYRFVSRAGTETTGAALSNTGYASDPQEAIQYASAHDNETLFDKILFSTPKELSLEDRARMQTVGLSVIALSQGIPFFHAGSELLRSKCFDADSYDSGDWFNRLDLTYASNNFGNGLPPAEKNRDRWNLIAPILGRGDLEPGKEVIEDALGRFESYLRIRKSSALFRLRDAEEIQARVRFHNTGPMQRESLIVMTISDDVTAKRADGTAFTSLDPDRKRVIVLVNAGPEEQSYGHPMLRGRTFRLHPALAAGTDGVVKTSTFDGKTGTFHIPARTTVVFEEPR